MCFITAVQEIILVQLDPTIFIESGGGALIIVTVYRLGQEKL